MTLPRIAQVRAYVVRGGGADYHDQGSGHWIDDHIATPMSKYPEYRQSRQSFGINVLGTLVVEIEAVDGTVGFAVTTGGEPACYLVEKHFARFLEGRDPAEYETIWEQMYLASQFYGRKGLVVNAISGVDLALWDLLGKLRGEPVHHLLGGAVRDELEFYATGSRPTSPSSPRCAHAWATTSGSCSTAGWRSTSTTPSVSRRLRASMA